MKTDWNSWLEKGQRWGKKYRFVLLIFALGIGLMLIPGKKAQDAVPAAPREEVRQDLQKELEALLRQVEGAGEVRVLLSWSTGTAYEYQQNVERKTGDSETEESRTTVLIKADGSEAAVPVRTIYPICKGAVVVCQGADRASVVLDLIRAVSSVTGLGSDRITVIKMQSGN